MRSLTPWVANPTKSPASWTHIAPTASAWAPISAPDKNYLYTDSTIAYSIANPNTLNGLSPNVWDRSNKSLSSWSLSMNPLTSYLYDDDSKPYDDVNRAYDYLKPLTNQLNNLTPTQWSNA